MDTLTSPDPKSDLDALLTARGSKYGKFSGHADITQRLKRDMMSHTPEGGKTATFWKLKPHQREALEMIAHKIGRILNGDPDYSDSWHDIAGYAKLVADDLDGKEAV